MNRERVNPFLIAAALTTFAAAPVVAASVAAEGSATASDKPRFDVWEFRVLGNSALAGTDIEGAVYQFLGAGKTIDDVEAARGALERAYHAAGYGTVFVDIPEQSTADGIVRLRVTEGRIDRVRITGARYFANGDIRAAVPELKQGKVPHLPEVQSQLNAVNGATADRSVVPILKAGRSPGAVDVELKVNDKLPLHGTLEVNDRYSADTSHLRVTGSLSYANLFQRQHSATFQYQTAPEETDDVTAIVGSYVFRPKFLPNTTFAAYAVDSETDVATLGTLSVIGNGQIFGLRAIQTLPRTAMWSHNVTFGVDYKDFKENILLEDDMELATPISYLNWSLVYAGTHWGESSRTGLSVGVNFGVRGFADDAVEFANKRFKGESNYLYLRASMEHLKNLPLHLQLYGRFAGQFTQTPLVSNEQFSLGGVDTVRGYLESSELGDYGASGTIELRQTWLSQLLGVAEGSAYVMAFYDAGIVQLLEPLPSQESTFDLASAGIGIRIEEWSHTTIALDWARALKDAGRIQSGESRAHFSVRFSF